MSEDAGSKSPEAGSEEDMALGRVIRGAVAEQLEGQRGRALAAFRDRLEKGMQIQHARRSPSPAGHGARSERLLKLWAGVASAMAACLAVVLTAQFVMRPKVADVALAPVSVPEVNQVTYTRNVDGGTVILDDQTPARMVRRQTVKQTEWFDPREKATYSVTEPIEKVEYMPLHPY